MARWLRSAGSSLYSCALASLSAVGTLCLLAGDGYKIREWASGTRAPSRTALPECLAQVQVKATDKEPPRFMNAAYRAYPSNPRAIRQ
ncbi:MAG: hypothetical protein C5B58_01660 [Acidobacteria bacterium]|nr:MAG: hypothetical protein C5B58_01660 [Acidobacteriota bacterium]